jgi:hypothetical protein
LIAVCPECGAPDNASFVLLRAAAARTDAPARFYFMD